MKKILCLLLTAILIFSTPIYAVDGSSSLTPITPESSDTWVVDLFTTDYVFFDFNGNDITTVFYQRMMPAYRIGDYATIAEYFINFVDYAEYTATAPVSPNGNAVLVTKTRRDVLQNIEELNHNFSAHNDFIYTVVLKYYYDAEEDIITSGLRPEVTEARLSNSYGSLPPVVEVSNRTYMVNSDGSYIQYAFDFEAFILLNTGDDPITDELGIAYYYADTVSITLNAGP